MSALTALLLAAVVNSSVSGGKTGEFEFLRGDVPPRIPQSVSEADTPGSTNWFSRVDSLRVPLHWAVWSNGVAVAAEVAGEPTVRCVSNLMTRCGDLNLVLDKPDGTSDTYFEGQFDTTWDGGTFYAVATSRTDFSCLDNYGFPLYWMKAHRLDERLFGSYLASYGAYWERLYHGSLADGAYVEEQPDAFTLDPTNYFVRTGTTNDFHRMLEHGNITNYMTHSADMFRKLAADVPKGSAVPDENKRHPTFVLRPGWILDPGETLPRETADARLCWATTRLPPIVLQDVGTGEMEYPDDLQLGRLMPQFPWTREAIAYRSAETGGAWRETQFWQCYALTLDTLLAGGANPIRQLFEAVGVSDDAGPIAYVRGYDCGGKTAFFRHAYAFAGRSAANADAADDAYQGCFGPHAFTLKNLPGAFVGANQTLALMDRMIYVPTVSMAYTNVSYDCWHWGRFESSGEVTVDVDYDEQSGRYYVTAAASNAVFAALCDDEDWGETETNRREDEWMILRVGRVTDYAPTDAGSFGSVSTPIDLDIEDAEAMFEDSPSSGELEIVGFQDSGNLLGVRYIFPDRPGETFLHRVLASPGDGRLTFRPSFSVRAEYAMTIPDTSSAIPWRTKRDLPMRATCGRTIGSEVAFLDRRDYRWAASGDADETVTEYKCEGQRSVVDNFATSASLHYDDFYFDMLDDADSRIGPYWYDAGAFTPFGDEPTFTVHAGSAFGVSSDYTVEPILPFSYDLREPYYYCDFSYVSAREFLQTNHLTVTRLTYNRERTYDVTEERREHAEGWVTETATTNLVSQSWLPDIFDETTNAMPAVLTGSATSLASTNFPVRKVDEVVFRASCGVITNLYLPYSMTEGSYYRDTYAITRVMKYSDGHEEIEHATDAVTTTNSFEYEGEDIDFVRGAVAVAMTGREVIAASTNVTVIEAVTTIPAYWRLYADGGWLHYYLDPSDETTEVTISEGRIPLRIGEYVVEVDADDGNTFDFSPPLQHFQGEYEYKARFAPIEANNYQFESMHRSDVNQ